MISQTVSQLDITKILARYISKPYALGDIDKGYDCLNLFYYFYKTIGVAFPEEFEGVTIKNYVQAWKSGNGRNIFDRFLMTLGIPINENYMRRGDLLLFHGDQNTVFCAIYSGNNSVVMNFETGCKVVSYRYLKRFLIGVRRFRELFTEKELEEMEELNKVDVE